MPSLARKTCVFFLLFMSLGLCSASGQESEYSDVVLPTWMEGLGYEDAHTGDLTIDDEPSQVEPGQEDPGQEGAVQAPASGTVGQGGGQPSCNCLHCRKTLTGDWGGARSCLRQNGIIYRGRTTHFFMGVGGGVQEPVLPPFAALGIAPGDTFAYTGNSRHDLIFDLDKFGGLPHSKFLFTMENIWGRFGNVGLSSGAIAPVVNALLPLDFDAAGVPRMTSCMYLQPMSENLIVGAGKLQLAGTADQDIFAGGDGSDQFLNQALSANPLFPGIMPISAFLVTTAMPQEWGHVAFNIIDPKDRTVEYFDFESLYSQGVILHTEVKVDTNFFCKPGEQHVGAIWKHGNMPDLQFTTVPPEYPYPPSNPYPPLPPTFASKSDASILYYGFDQYLEVFEGSGAVPRGWGLFGRAGIADGGTGNPNFSAWTAQVGFGGDSLLQNRQAKGDRWGLGYNYTATSSEWGPVPQALFGPRDDQVVEMYYRYHLTPYIQITPDVQWVSGVLGGLTDGNDAVIAGIRMNIVL